MQLTSTHTFDAPIDAVWAMFSDPESHLAKFASMGHREIEVLEQEVDDDRLRIVVSRVVDVELPGFARKVLSPSNTVVSDDRWERRDDGTCGGTFTVDTKGAPVKASGTTRLTPDGDRTDYEVTVEVDVKVPVIGRKIADWAKGDIAAQFDQEFAAGDAWLAEHA